MYETHELAQERDARGRRELRDVGGKGKGRTGGQQTRKLNLFTYKLHSLGDYLNSIKRYGTSDGFSTQVVSLLYVLYFIIY